MRFHGLERHLFGLALLCVGLLPPARGATLSQSEERTQEWDRETIDLIATLPVQHRGRVKPLESVAGLNLLMINGKRTLEIEGGEKLKPSAWLLDCLFFPEQAKAYRAFRIENDGVLTALGLDARKKRDWYSYDEIARAKHKLASAAQRAIQKETAERSPVERQLLKLYHDQLGFESLIEFLDPLRRDYPTGGSEALVEVFGGNEAGRLSAVLTQMPRVRELRGGLDPDGDPDREAVDALLRELDSVLRAASAGPAIFPPHPGAQEPMEWWTMGDLVAACFGASADFSAQIELLAAWERLEASKHDGAAFHAELAELKDALVGQAAQRGEYQHIPLEVKLNRWSLFTNALVFYLLGFLLLTGTWLAPRLRALRAGVLGSVGIATALVITGIVLRCIIRARPPVVTLYDTILFITAVIVVVALIMEWITRQRIGIGVATVLGVFGMFLAGRYELKEVASAGDTMASVVAVLDTNYYLAIHVTTITMGYAGGLLASGIAHVWIFGRLLGIRRGDNAFYKSITRMVYGVVCFCLLFSIFGTIMGGVWANDSWGRFWGWDPKENGALLICIWQLLTLHARMGGYIKDRGFAVMAVLGGVVVSASWWGVNLLNVGLHSYGFTSGVAMLLLGSWAIEAVVILLSWLDHFRGGRGGPPVGSLSANG
jgi:ABC-type transport system involved in cytochrome c biogenesis permease subunit